MGNYACTVHIAGRDFTLTTQDESKEKTQRIAAYVDRKINEIALQTLTSREVAAVISALSIAEELMDAQDENRRLRDALFEAQNAYKEKEINETDHG